MITSTDHIIAAITTNYPAIQAIYLFGSYATENERPDSDLDIALLLAPDTAKREGNLVLHPLRPKLEKLLNKDVDLINLRQVSTVFQKEIIGADRRVYTGDAYAADEFEMLVLSFYQKLNEERAEIIEEGLHSGTFYSP